MPTQRASVWEACLEASPPACCSGPTPNSAAAALEEAAGNRTGGGVEEVGRDRDRRAARRLGGVTRRGRGVGIDRARRAAVERRLCQHVIVQDDWLVGAAFGNPHAALLGNLVPIGGCLVIEGAA